MLPFYFVGAAVHNERIFVFGGSGLEASYSEVYDPNTDGWTHFVSMPLPRCKFVVGAIKDGIYAAGGIVLSGHYSTNRY